MTRFINLFLLPVIAGAIAVTALNMLLPLINVFGLSMAHTYEIAGALGFFGGFLPCFIYGCAVVTLARMKPVNADTVDQAAPREALTVGQVLTRAGANCAFRVKVLHVADFSGLNDQFNYCLQFNY